MAMILWSVFLIMFEKLVSIMYNIKRSLQEIEKIFLMPNKNLSSKKICSSAVSLNYLAPSPYLANFIEFSFNCHFPTIKTDFLLIRKHL